MLLPIGKGLPTNGRILSTPCTGSLNIPQAPSGRVPRLRRPTSTPLSIAPSPQGLLVTFVQRQSVARRSAGDIWYAKEAVLSAVAQAESEGHRVTENFAVIPRNAFVIPQAEAHAADIAARVQDLTALDGEVASNLTTTAARVQPVDFKRDTDPGGGGPIPPMLPNPYNTPNCDPGKILKLQGNVAIGALEIQGAIAALTSIVGAVLFPFGIKGGWDRIVGAKDEYNRCLGE
jgi:hypothetical protein